MGGTYYGSSSGGHGQQPEYPQQPGYQQQPEYPPATAAWPQPPAPGQPPAFGQGYAQQPPQPTSPAYAPQADPMQQPPYAAPTPPPRKSGGGKALLIVGIAAGVLLLLCVGGGLIVALTADDLKLPDTSTTADAGADPSAEEDIQGNIGKYKKGDCLTINADNDVRAAECTAAGAYQVLLRKDGTTAESACADTGATESLYQDGAIGTKDDFILCIAPVK
ncbi:LppU/SCO3897 family protein [Phytohabitans aurantiacus]|jgi:hypothetical protein|uniref:Uncharacterized protein n=1 Tax=Phytohabitans aurantiacus TaxID=3016789 RepID=A0ABQ5R5D5_9ACTN|nr:hypothetical protein [Phytohabitans aurantiacus]GLI01402.1 hypothetical protein Pa4123_66780 [Phytohabitans aurantiacus]